MTEMNAEANSLIDVMNLAKKRAQEQVEKLFAQADPKKLDMFRHYLEEEDPHLWDHYTDDYVEQNHYDSIIEAIGRDPKNIGLDEYYSLANAYEEVHCQEWLAHVERLIKGE